MKKKILSIATLLLIAITCFAAACGEKAVEETYDFALTDEIYREELYINKAYSIDNLVKKEEGATYTFEQLFYVDDEFNKHELTHVNGVFTQTEPYDVTAIIKGKKDGQVGTKKVDLKINFNSNAYYDAWLNAWSDPGVVRTLTARQECLTGDAETAFKVQIMSSYNPVGDGVNFGSFAGAYSDFGVTDWSNTVLSMDVYNTADYDLQIGYLLNKTGDNDDYEICMRDKLLSKQWTRVTLSFRSLGYNINFFEKGSMSFKVRALGGFAPYDYTMYFCNVEVSEYTAEKFPDVETRTDSEIRSDMYTTSEGDELDKKLVAFTTSHSNYSSVTDTKYTHSEESMSSIKFTYYYDAFTGDPTPYRANMLLDDNILFDEFGSKITDWGNAYVSFWVRNAAGCNINLGIRFATKKGDEWKGFTDFRFDSYAKQLVVTDKTGEWSFVEISLSELAEAFGKTYHKTGVTGFKLCLCSEISGLEEGDSGSFYIDDFKITEGSIKSA